MADTAVTEIDLGAAADVHVDGRHARRDRNKHLVVAAYLDLVRAGNPRPSVLEVAERSGVSHRSVFRYFTDRDELVQTAIEHQHQLARPLARMPIGPDAPLEERLNVFVERRLDLYEALGAVARLSRSLATFEPVIAGELRRVRTALRLQIAHLFSPELDAMDDATRRGAIAGVDVLCSFEAVDLLRDDQGLSRKAAALVVTDGLRAFLGIARS
jgi:TetR/AcrR family transcriptional regulator, regulator of autoinduction and epiphytic fitness